MTLDECMEVMKTQKMTVPSHVRKAVLGPLGGLISGEKYTPARTFVPKKKKLLDGLPHPVTHEEQRRKR